MLIKSNIKELRDAISQTSYTLDSKAASIGSWLYLMARPGAEGETGKLYVYSSNLGLARTLLKIPAEVSKGGEAIIQPKLLQSILANLPEEDTIELGLSASGAKLQVKYGAIKSELAVHTDSKKANEVLQTIPFNAKPSFVISASTLVDIIKRTIFCAASSQAAISEGPWMSSVYLATSDNTIVGTATNRVIAGKAELNDQLVTGGYSMGIHRDALGALKALLSKREKEEVTITNAKDSTGSTSIPSNEVLFRFSDVILGVRQLATGYPSLVEKIFKTPSEFLRATINRKLLLNTFSRLGPFAEKNYFTLSFSDQKITLYTKGYNSIFQEQVAKKETNEKSVTIGLGIVDFTNILSAMSSEEVVLYYKSNGDHIHIQEGDLNFKYVLSPVAVDWESKK